MPMSKFKMRQPDIIEPIQSELEDEQSVPMEYDITSYPADFTLEVLYKKWKAKPQQISIPSYQRGYVWSQGQASRLIDSFLMGLPVPSIFLYTDRRSESLLVLDGQQRLLTAFNFFSGIIDKKEFRLLGLNPEVPWYNKTYEELGDRFKNRLLNTVLRAIVIKQTSPKNDESSVYHIFERLNTGGTTLVGQEIRNCIYAGPFNDLLKRLNRNESWRKIFGNPRPQKKMRDVELILRFFSLYKNLIYYKKPMKDFLSSFMASQRDAPDKILTKYEKIFTEVSDIILEKLGETPFHLRSTFNAAAYDSVFVAVAKNIDNLKANLLANYQRLCNDDGYMQYTSSGTTDIDTIHRRIELAEKYLTKNN